MDEVILRKYEKKDIIKIKEWYTEKKEWMLWDAPWEEVEYDEDSQMKHRIERTNNKPCFEYEIIYNNKHVGWISAYYIKDDFKYCGMEKTDRIAIGLDIPEESVRRKGIAIRAMKQYLEYFKNLEYNQIYTQTWNGNIPMVNLAKKIGFSEINRYKEIRKVKGEEYDALTFTINIVNI